MDVDFEYLLELVGNEPVFESAFLLAGKVNPDSVRIQLTRWVKSGRVYQLRRGLYALAPPYQKVKPHPFVVANRLQRASYVSLQSALSFYGLIPDIVQATLSVTACRPRRWETPLGVYEFRRVKPDLLRGYHMVKLQNGTKPAQGALVATPEKALLDLVYLQPGGDGRAYLRELRLQNLERLNIGEFERLAKLFDTPKLNRAVETITGLAQSEVSEYETL